MSQDSSAYSIYTLSDPRDTTIRYVGITANLEQRYLAHIKLRGEKRAISKGKYEWIKDLQQNGLKPLMQVIESHDDLKWAKEREIFWIQHYRQYVPLTNAAYFGAYHGKRVHRPFLMYDLPDTLQLLTVKQAAEYLHRSVSGILLLINSGRIVVIKLGKEYRIRRSVLNDFLERKQIKPEKDQEGEE